MYIDNRTYEELNELYYRIHLHAYNQDRLILDVTFDEKGYVNQFFINFVVNYVSEHEIINCIYRKLCSCKITLPFFMSLLQVSQTQIYDFLYILVLDDVIQYIAKKFETSTSYVRYKIINIVKTLQHYNKYYAFVLLNDKIFLADTYINVIRENKQEYTLVTYQELDELEKYIINLLGFSYILYYADFIYSVTPYANHICKYLLNFPFLKDYYLLILKTDYASDLAYLMDMKNRKIYCIDFKFRKGEEVKRDLLTYTTLVFSILEDVDIKQYSTCKVDEVNYVPDIIKSQLESGLNNLNKLQNEIKRRYVGKALKIVKSLKRKMFKALSLLKLMELIK